jgi:ribose/xylose/arabinose/galactoside ABC-type transport system permease subunit
MTDEAALLLRVSVFGLVAGVVYWYLSYEALGTVTLLLLGAGTAFAGIYLVLVHRRSQGAETEPIDAVVRRFAGAPPADPAGPRTLEDEDLAVIPLPSIWPFAASLGVAIALSGLIFGLWLVLLGLGVAVYSGWGWIAAIARETRYGRDLPPDDAEGGAAGEAGYPGEPHGGEDGGDGDQAEDPVIRRH